LFHGYASIELAVHAGSGASLSAINGMSQGSAGDNSRTHQYITGVQIGAAVISFPNRRMYWNGVTIKFYRNGVLREGIVLPPECPPVADTYSPNGRALQIAQHNPSAGDNDAVVIDGIITLDGNRGTPSFDFNPTDFYAKILVFASGCNPR
jgi:hypothetical protein